jgi:hypothetical protein
MSPVGEARDERLPLLAAAWVVARPTPGAPPRACSPALQATSGIATP